MPMGRRGGRPPVDFWLVATVRAILTGRSEVWPSVEEEEEGPVDSEEADVREAEEEVERRRRRRVRTGWEKCSAGREVEPGGPHG